MIFLDRREKLLTSKNVVKNKILKNFENLKNWKIENQESLQEKNEESWTTEATFNYVVDFEKYQFLRLRS